MNVNATTRFWTDVETPLGRLTLTANERGLDGLFFPGRAPERDEAGHAPDRFDQAITQLDEYFAGTRREFALQLDLTHGRAFQQSVWSRLQAIPYGQTASYGQLAASLGRSDGVRAVGAAVGRTPIPIIVPCHRVIGADGGLTGYLGGLQRKRALLDLEATVISGHKPPKRFVARQLTML